MIEQLRSEDGAGRGVYQCKLLMLWDANLSLRAFVSAAHLQHTRVERSTISGAGQSVCMRACGCHLQGASAGPVTPQQRQWPHNMDLVALARKLALAFADGESNNALSATLQALFPSAAYMRCSAALTDGLGNNMHARCVSCPYRDVQCHRVASKAEILAAQPVLVRQQPRGGRHQQPGGQRLHDAVPRGR